MNQEVEKLEEVLLSQSLREILYSFRKNGGDLEYCVQQIRDDFRKAGYLPVEHKTEQADLREAVGNILDFETSLCLNPTEVGKDDCGNETDSPACRDCQLEQILSLFPEYVEVHLEVLGDELRAKFLEYLTIDSKTHDARRKDFNQAIFIDPEDKMSGGKQVFNGTDLDMIMGKFDKAKVDHNQKLEKIFRRIE